MNASTISLEQLRPALRAIFERAYLADPALTHRQLFELGYTTVVAQLKIDWEMGRLPTAA